MRTEVLHTQRHLAGLRLHMADAELVTKYVFPFVREDWKVAFTVVDAMTYGPRVLHGGLELRGGGLFAKEALSALKEIDSVPLQEFDRLVHFDPWWALRGVSGVERDWVKAILASNIAGTFNHEGTTYKLHDLEFTAGLDAVDAVIAKDPVFHTVSFRRSDLDLLLLRHPAGK